MPEKENPYRDFAKHVVKFADGTYLGISLKHAERVTHQSDAQRWLTWSCAKLVAEAFPGTGARAVRLIQTPELTEEQIRVALEQAAKGAQELHEALKTRSTLPPESASVLLR